MAKERPPLEDLTLRQLRKIASEYSISRYSRMRKGQLLTSIEQAIQKTFPTSPPSATTSTTTSITTAPSLTTPPSTDIFRVQEEQKVEASKFELGQDDQFGGLLSSVDDGLGDLPDGYGESRIVLLPRDPQWAYAYWDIPNSDKEELRRQGGQQLALRLYDVTDINLDYQSPHNVQEYLSDELAREWYLPIPVSDRDYAVDIGYRTADGRWLTLARSARVRIPPFYPSDWIEDVFVSVSWEEDLVDTTVYDLISPSQQQVLTSRDFSSSFNPIHDEIFGLANGAQAQRVAGSIFGSQHQVPGAVLAQQPLSSNIFPSGVGLWAAPTLSGLTASGAGISGYGFGSAETPIRPRQFWLVADAELIVYGATEPDATVTIGGRPIKLNPDGTFRFQLSFQDGLLDYPIWAVAADGEQTRSIHLKFNRETPSRHTNTKEDAVLEWLN
jgi:hypothetical protein